MTEEELLSIEAMASKAVPGPWSASANGDHLTSNAVRSVVMSSSDLDYVESPYARNSPTMLFIAASRTAVPALCAEVRRLRALLDSLREADPNRYNAVVKEDGK